METSEEVPQPKPRSTIIKRKCSFCSVVAQEISREKEDDGYISIRLACGHTTLDDAIDSVIEIVEDDNIRVIDEIDSGIQEVFDEVNQTIYDRLQSTSGKRPYKFQLEGMKFIEDSNFRCLITDEMGLGKTIQALGALKLHPELLPAIVVTKASLTTQWFREAADWLQIPAQILGTSDDFPILPGSIPSRPELGFELFIISVDTLSRAKWINDPERNHTIKTVILDECQTIKNMDAKRTKAVRTLCNRSLIQQRIYTPDLPKRDKIKQIALDLFKYHGIIGRFKLSFENLNNKILGLCECRVEGEGMIHGQITISKRHAENDKEDDVIETILHEIAHAITPGAGHSKIWQQTSLSIGGNGQAVAGCNGSIEPKNEFKEEIKFIGLSGTPIKNHLGEYFPVLNIIRPERFHAYNPFLHEWSDGRGIKYWRQQEWKDLTSTFVIRRMREEVLPDLPKIQRNYIFTRLGKEVAEAYNKIVAQMIDDEDNESMSQQSKEANVLAYMAKMRHLTGQAKIRLVLDQTEQFLTESDDKKIVIFVHHRDVGDLLLENLNKTLAEMNQGPCLKLSGETPGKERSGIVDEFRDNPKRRILIASTLAAGEGLNMQFCQNAIMMEREWNPANEEQAEGRFSRIGADFDSVYVTYPTAEETIDEFLAELVEKKRVAMKQALDHKNESWSESNVMKELARKVREAGRIKWRPV